MNNPIITVAVISYNPVWEKFKNTLKSITWQKNIEFEIIIADDGSKNDCFEKVEKFFEEQKFSNYKLVKNSVNQGTVKNVLSAVKIAKGKYIKLISPGDFLYDEDTLKQSVDFAESNPSTFYFGNMFYYSVDENKNITLYNNKKNPSDLRPWKTHNIKQIRYNYLVKRDYICGAVSMYNTQKLYEYIDRISSIVTFADDCSMIYMIAKNESVYYMNVPGGVWYEYGAGVSTQKSDIWNIRLVNDNKNLFSLLLKEKLISKWLFNLHFSENKIQRNFLRLIYNPMSYFNRLFSKKIKGYEDIYCDINKLKKILQ